MDALYMIPTAFFFLIKKKKKKRVIHYLIFSLMGKNIICFNHCYQAQNLLSNNERLEFCVAGKLPYLKNK
jgi:hypothetical protein